MTLIETFIRHKVGTSLFTIGVVLVGILAFFSLPIAPMPQVEYPTIQVQASLPGASAETMATSVATPLERSFSIISGISQMTSASSLGVTTIVLQFDLNRSIDGAAQDVQTAINAAGGLLPKNLPNPPTYSKTDPTDYALLSLALTSDTMPLTEIDRYADDFIAQQISQLLGVGLVDFHGEQRPAVRIQLDPDKLTSLGLSFDDVRNIVGLQTVNAPKGAIKGRTQSVVLNTTDQVVKAEEYESLVVAYKNGAPIRIGDLGTVIDAPEDLLQAAWLGTKRAVVIDVHKQPGFNIFDTVKRIKEQLPLLTAAMPAAMHLTIVADRTQTIQASIADGQRTMLLTVALVVLVILGFLRNFWATIIPSLTIPLSLIATFAAMYVLGYSLNNLTLMGLTIAIGFVVDDAIVVIENVIRHIEMGKPRVQAAIDGAREIAFTIVSMTVSLIAVFIPILMMSGIVGRVFREFALTVSVALIMSGLISLSVTPMMCALLVRQRAPEAHGRLYRVFEWIFDAAIGLYAKSLDRVLRHRFIMLVVTLATLGTTLWLYVVAPKGFFPLVDTGLIAGVARTSPDVAFDLASERIQAVAQIAAADPDIANVYYWVGANPVLSDGRVNFALKPFDQRRSTASEIIARLKKKFAALQGISVFMQVRQDIQTGGRFTATQYQYTLQDADLAELTQWANILLAKFSTLPQLRDVASDAQASASSATLHIDRDTLSRFGITATAIDDVLYNAFGQRQIATIFTQLNQYKVVLEVDPRFQLTTETLDHLYVLSPLTGQLVPLSVLAHVVHGVSPITINHQGLFPSITLSFNLAPGVALGDAVNAIETAEANAGKPDALIATFQGTAQTFQSSLKNQPWLLLATVVVVYIILGILYEDAVHPLTIISTLPSAGVGALLALRLFGQDLSIMGMIGIILLIGIVKKNAIMMIDFALAAERKQGMSPFEAIRQGCLLRFRPIMMTTMAALLGALPLAFGTGAGAELRRPLGIAIVGGLMVSQLLTLYTTPVIYLWFDQLRRGLRNEASGTASPPSPSQAPLAGGRVAEADRGHVDHDGKRAFRVHRSNPR